MGGEGKGTGLPPPYLTSGYRPVSNRAIYFARRAHSSKSTAAAAAAGWDRDTDRQTDARHLHRPCSA